MKPLEREKENNNRDVWTDRIVGPFRGTAIFPLCLSANASQVCETSFSLLLFRLGEKDAWLTIHTDATHSNGCWYDIMFVWVDPKHDRL